MKSSIFFQIIYFVLIFLILISISSEETVFKAFQLNSNEVVIVSESGIFHLGKDFSIQPTKKISFDSYLTLTNIGEIELLSVSQFSEEEKSYILCRIKKTIFLISPDFSNYTYVNISFIPNDYIDIVPYKYENNSFVFFINIIETSNRTFPIHIYKYSINIENNNLNKLINEQHFKPNNSLGTDMTPQCKYINCHLMINEILTCFFKLAYPNTELVFISFDSKNLKKLEKFSGFSENSNGNFYKSAQTDDKTQVIFCGLNGDIEILCSFYDITRNKWTKNVKIFPPLNFGLLVMDVYYFVQTKEFYVLGNIYNTALYTVKFDRHFNLIKTNQKEENCYSYLVLDNNCYVKNSYNLLYSILEKKYVLITGCSKDSFVMYNVTEECDKNYDSEINFFEGISNWFTENDTNIIEDVEDKEIEYENESEKKNEEKNIEENLEQTEENKEENIDNKNEENNEDKNIEKNEEINEENNEDKNMEKNEDINEEENIEQNEENNNIDQVVILSTNISREDISSNLDGIIDSIEIGKFYIINSNDYSIKISPIDNKNLTNQIDFGECENILRTKNNLTEEEQLILLIIEIDKQNKQSLNSQIEYAVYNDKKEKLDLSVCKDLQIKINYEIKNDTQINIDLISNFSNNGIDVFNITDSFFNDICYPYISENDTDLILNDRIKYIYQNYSLCDNNCSLLEINKESNTISCECNIKEEISTEIEELEFSQAVKSTFKDSNINVLKCYNLVFNIKNNLNNYGFQIFFLLLLCHIPLIIIYFIKERKSLSNFIFSEMEKNNYISNPLKKKKLTKIIDKEKRIIKSKQQITNFNNNNNNNSNSPVNDINSVSPVLPRRNSKLKTLSFSKNGSKKNKPIIEKKNNCPGYYNLLHIDIGNNKKNINDDSYILNNYLYEQAAEKDFRDYWRIYYIYLLNTEKIIHTFFFKSEIEPFCLRLLLFIFIISCNFALNGIFYFNDKISERYHYEGNNLIFFSLVNNLTISVTSTFINYPLMFLLSWLIKGRYQIENLFTKEEKKILNNKKFGEEEKKKLNEKVIKTLTNIKKRNLLFIIIECVFMMFFTYFIIAFCAVYKGTQMSWLVDSFVSLLFSAVVECIIVFFATTIYINGLRYKIEILFNIAVLIYKIL